LGKQMSKCQGVGWCWVDVVVNNVDDGEVSVYGVGRLGVI